MRHWYARSLVGLMLGLAVTGSTCIELPVGPEIVLSSADPILGGGGPTTSSICDPIGTPDSVSQQQMYQALNSYRVANGQQELQYSDALEDAAQFQARDLYERNFFDHISPDGGTPWDRAVAAGFCEPSWIGENIAKGQRSVMEVQVGWQHSPGHNANMLRDIFTCVGMGHYPSPLGVNYWVQLFGTTNN
jgi:uncharacterized protein YkwD